MVPTPKGVGDHRGAFGAALVGRCAPVQNRRQVQPVLDVVLSDARGSRRLSGWSRPVTRWTLTGACCRRCRRKRTGTATWRGSARGPPVGHGAADFRTLYPYLYGGGGEGRPAACRLPAAVQPHKTSCCGRPGRPFAGATGRAAAPWEERTARAAAATHSPSTSSAQIGGDRCLRLRAPPYARTGGAPRRRARRC